MRENIASSGKAAIAERRAPRGHVLVEILDIQGQTLAFDQIAVEPLPVTAMEIAGAPATRVIFPDDTAQQEVTISADADLPLTLPSHLRSRAGAHTIRLWWSCNDK